MSTTQTALFTLDELVELVGREAALDLVVGRLALLSPAVIESAAGAELAGVRRRQAAT